MKFPTLLLALFLVISCKNNTKNASSATSETEKYYLSGMPKGTVVAADSIQIPDPLNSLYFSVRLLTNEQSQNGIYDIETKYGYNDAATQITMPEGDKLIKPLLRRSPEPFTYIIGFTYGDDTTFNDYFKISSGREQTKMGYIKSYSFQ